ncbi:MAG: AAA family ATPase [Planktomarina sp.]
MQALLVTRSPEGFAVLVEDMADILGDEWGELTPREAQRYLVQSDAQTLDCVIIAIDEDDTDTIDDFAKVSELAKSVGLPTLVIAEDLDEADLADVLSHGNLSLLPYPMEKQAFALALAGLPKRLHMSERVYPSLIAVQGMTGGTGSTSLANAITTEIACQTQGRVCVIDLDVQYGTLAQSLGATSTADITALLSQNADLDPESFMQALSQTPCGAHVLSFAQKLWPLTEFPRDWVDQVLTTACAMFDYVVVDMPKAMAPWSADVLTLADLILCPVEADNRTADATSRLMAHFAAQDWPADQLHFVLNRAKSDVDSGAMNRLLKNAIQPRLADAGPDLDRAARMGKPLREVSPLNPYLRDVQSLVEKTICPAALDTAAA